MKSKVVIVFNQPYRNLKNIVGNNIPETVVFNNNAQLMEFLRGLDFSRAHISGDDFMQYPEFRLGTKTIVYTDDRSIESDVRWGPRFVFGNNVRVENKSVVVSVMRDVPCSDKKGLVRPRLCNVKLRNGSYDAVIQPGNKLKQIWPRVENSRGELVRFMTSFAREREKSYCAR